MMKKGATTDITHAQNLPGSEGSCGSLGESADNNNYAIDILDKMAVEREAQRKRGLD